MIFGLCFFFWFSLGVDSVDSVDSVGVDFVGCVPHELHKKFGA